MLMERNTLMEWVYPKIKEYCKEKHGLEFQVVDMRWGVRDEMTNEHMTRTWNWYTKRLNASTISSSDVYKQKGPSRPPMPPWL